jgi:prepilin-type N-terminal cleavage/methylation domain-containing protein
MTIKQTHSQGFTLIEVIMTIVVVAIAATLLVTTLGRNLTQSTQNIVLVRGQYQLIEQMEILTSRYRQAISNQATWNVNTFIADNVTPGTCSNCIEFVDTTNPPALVNLKSGAYTTQPVWRVTLRDGLQSIQAYFSQ